MRQTFYRERLAFLFGVMMSFHVAVAVPATQHTIIRIYEGPQEQSVIKTLPGLVDLLVHPSDKCLIAGFSNGTVGLLNQSGIRKEIYKRTGLTKMAMSSAGRYLALGYSDGTVAMLTLGGDPLDVVSTTRTCRHNGPVTSLAFTPIPTILLSGGTDQLLCMSNESLELIQCCEGHTSEVSHICASTDGKCMTAGGAGDDTMKLWDLKTGAELATSQMFPAGITAMCGGRTADLVYFGTAAGRLGCYSLTEDKLLTLHDSVGSINKIVYSPRANQLATATGTGFIDYFFPLDLANQISAAYCGGTVVALDAFKTSKGPQLT